MSGYLIVAGAILALAGIACVMQLRGGWLSDRVARSRAASHATWVGLEDLDPRELAIVVELRYSPNRWTGDQVRDRILRRRALAEDLRRNRLPGNRGKGGRRRRQLRPPL